ncbi:cytochrome P450 [Bombardia bombarda]|uniref:Cytochrome P450 n=1 Tax=Bombardia bombarda TaxID=252184 RepID=A0AA39U603_9PEZI|nr:cytochrome P450 [Bombardia bombarda]
MASQIFFYLVGDDPTTAKAVSADPEWNNEDLKRAVGLVLHVASPLGITFHTPTGEELSTLPSIIASISPVGCRIDGQAVQDPQGPAGLPIVGSFDDIFPDHLGNHYCLFRKYGHVIKTTNMGKATYLTDDPDAALTENWRLAHKFLPAAMGPKAVRHYAPLMQDCVRASFPVFDELNARGEAWNVYQYMVKLASQTVGKFALGMDFGHFAAVDTPMHPLAVDIVTLLALNKKVTSRGEWYKALPFGDPARLQALRKTIYTQLQEAIDAAPDSGIGRLPLSEAAIKASCVADCLVHAVDEKGESFPPGLVLANMTVVTGAGYTTTSSLLSWLIYCIVTYPGTQDRILQDLIDADFDPATTEWTTELAHDRLPYLDKFVKETQWLHNASFQPGRTTKTDVVLPGGYRLPADAAIVPALYAIQTNPDHWHDPFRFDPERWDTEEVKIGRHRGAYLPFATGPRGCIGFNFALLEVKILLSELVYRYEFAREGQEAIEYDPEFQLTRPLNLFVTTKKRTSWPEKTAAV